MSQNIHAYLIVMITGKMSIPETGITTECWLPNLKHFQYGEWSPLEGSAFMIGPPPVFLLKSSDPPPQAINNDRSLNCTYSLKEEKLITINFSVNVKQKL